MKRILRGILIGGLIAVLTTFPVLAAYYAYITVMESNGNDYDELPVIVSRNITQLAQYGLITSTGLDTRVATGDGYVLPHMLAEDKLLLVTDLAGHEQKVLVFYTGQSSLSSFPVIVGYGGNVTTADDVTMEPSYVMEILVSGYFDTSAGSNKNVVYKDDVIKVYISAANTLRVVAYNSTGGEQWSMQYANFITGEHVVYIPVNGLAAKLYVDDFVTPKDTADLYEEYDMQIDNVQDIDLYPVCTRTFYANGRYWAFWTDSQYSDYIYYRTSTDGQNWDSEASFAVDDASDEHWGFSVCFNGTYMHIAYFDYHLSTAYLKYRMGTPDSGGNITWAAGWQSTDLAYMSSGLAKYPSIVTDTGGYPMVYWNHDSTTAADAAKAAKSSTNNGTWTTAGGYPTQWTSATAGTIGAAYGSDYMYVTATQSPAPAYNIYGRLYNGSSWSGSWETVKSVAGSTIVGASSCVVGDADGNFYIVWEQNDGAYHSVHMRVRYSTGVFSDDITLATYAYYPSVAYNPDSNVVYMLYNHNAWVSARAFSLNEGEISAESSLFSYSSGAKFTSARSGNRIGILTSSPTYVNHGYLAFPWEWNDNSNDWTWMQNNVMPYADDLMMGVEGSLVMHYQPAAIVEDSTLLDESDTGNPGTINWGTNPAGVTATMSPLHPSEEEGVTGTVTPPSGTSQDVVGPTGNPGYTSDIGTLTGNPFYPLVKALSDNTNIPVQLWWIILASIIILICMVVTYRYLPHQIITALVGGGLSCFFYAMGIYPFWIIFIFAVLALAIIIGERSPTV